MWDTIKNKKQIWEGVIKNKAKNEKPYFVKTLITPILDLDGNIVEYIAIRDNLNSIIDDKSHLFKQIEKNNLSILVLLQIDEFEMLKNFIILLL